MYFTQGPWWALRCCCEQEACVCAYNVADEYSPPVIEEKQVPCCWTVSYSGFINDINQCYNCNDLNTSYIIAQDEPSGCTWSCQQNGIGCNVYGVDGAIYKDGGDDWHFRTRMHFGSGGSCNTQNFFQGGYIEHDHNFGPDPVDWLSIANKELEFSDWSGQSSCVYPSGMVQLSVNSTDPTDTSTCCPGIRFQNCCPDRRWPSSFLLDLGSPPPLIHWWIATGNSCSGSGCDDCDTYESSYVVSNFSTGCSKNYIGWIPGTPSPYGALKCDFMDYIYFGATCSKLTTAPNHYHVTYQPHLAIGCSAIDGKIYIDALLWLSVWYHRPLMLPSYLIAGGFMVQWSSIVGYTDSTCSNIFPGNTGVLELGFNYQSWDNGGFIPWCMVSGTMGNAYLYPL